MRVLNIYIDCKIWLKVCFSERKSLFSWIDRIGSKSKNKFTTARQLFITMTIETEKIIFIFINSKVNAGFQFQVLENINILFMIYQPIIDALNFSSFLLSQYPSTVRRYKAVDRNLSWNLVAAGESNAWVYQSRSWFNNLLSKLGIGYQDIVKMSSLSSCIFN